MAKLTMADGTTVEFAGINGNNFIVPDKKQMDTSIFTDSNLKAGTIETDDGESYEFKNLRFTQQQKQLNGDYYICFHEITPQEKEDDTETLLLQVACAEVEAGAVSIDDIPLLYVDEIRQKMDADKKLEL